VKKRRKKGVKAKPKQEVLASYSFISNRVPIQITIRTSRNEFVPIYEVSIRSISKNTDIILDRIRHELISEVNIGMVDVLDIKNTGTIEQRLKNTIELLVKKHFPDADKDTEEFLVSYVIQKSLGMGKVEILMDDAKLEEIAINSAEEPVWVYHRDYGWVKTNINLQSEDQIKHYAAMIGRKVGRQITIMEPLMDANLTTGDRVNATISPISLNGHTITLRKFASKPWTITDFIKSGSISPAAASMIWLAIQYELSTLIAGGTASGKTSMLNVVSNFFPPNQRIISIEDTHEIQLPKFLHWVPMITRLPNPEGKGGVSMLDLLVNSLRMRPDRIIVGEIRRKREAAVLFEAIHTGHSVYATLHANSASETITRLTSPPIDIPKTMIPALSLIIVQYRNRRSGLRRTFQIAEILPDGNASVLMQLDINKDKLIKQNRSTALFNSIEMYTGMSRKVIQKDIDFKERVLNWMVKQGVDSVDTVGRVMAEYYTNQGNLKQIVLANRPFSSLS